MIERAKGLGRGKKKKKRIGLHRYVNEGRKSVGRFTQSIERKFIRKFFFS